jgi:hypothetical protein
MRKCQPSIQTRLRQFDGRIPRANPLLWKPGIEGFARMGVNAPPNELPQASWTGREFDATSPQTAA